MTVRKTPENGEPFRIERCRAVVRPSDPPGLIAYRIVDEVIEDYLDLVDTITDEIEEVDDHVEDWSPSRSGGGSPTSVTTCCTSVGRFHRLATRFAK